MQFKLSKNKNKINYIFSRSEQKPALPKAEKHQNDNKSIGN